MTLYELAREVGNVTFYAPGQWTIKEILRSFTPIEERQHTSTLEEIDKAVAYSVQKYGQLYKKLEAVDGAAEPQEIAKLKIVMSEDVDTDLLRLFKPLIEKQNEIMESHNTLLKEVADLRKKVG